MRSSERRAAKVASTKIAENAKYLASNKIMATTALPPPPTPRKPKAQAKPPTPKQSSGPQQQPPKITFRQPAQIAPTLLPKMPILVFNSLGSAVPTIIPIPTSSLTPNSIVTIAPTVTRPSVKPSLSTVPKKPATFTISSSLLSQPSSKFLRYNSTTRHSIGLSMECDEETLSPVQWAKYRKAESDYLDVLRKLTRWKSRNDVEIVYLGADDPVPPPPRFLNAQEASRQPVPTTFSGPTTSLQEVFIEPESIQMQVEQQSPILRGTTTKEGTTISALNPLKVIVSPRLNLVVTPTVKPQLSQTTTTMMTTATTSSIAEKPAKAMGEVKKEIVKQTDLATTCRSVIDLAKHPELVVKLCPQKVLPRDFIVNKQQELDAFLTKLMQSGRTNLEKWMLEKGLFGASRVCLFHPQIQMKLMIMSCANDEGKKNGYKWWCPSCAIMVPVDHGSFFSKWKQDHCAVLRTIYHWVCNSDTKMAIQEMLGNKEFVHSVYTALRSVCTKQSRNWRLGGTGHPIEIALVKLGNCKGSMQVIAYCAFDRVTQHVRLGATNEAAINNKITVLLNYFIERESFILGDRSLMKFLPEHFRENFISNSSQLVNVTSTSSQLVNVKAVAYLNDIVLPIVRDVKTYLKLETIVGLLHELEWRERFGRDHLKAFDSIVTHIKQVFITSVVTTQSASSVPITMASGLKVIDISHLAKDIPKPLDKTSSTRSDTSSESKATDVKNVDGQAKENRNCSSPITAPMDSVSCLKRTRMSNDDNGPVYSAMARKKAKTSVTKREVIKVSETIRPLRVPLECYYYGTKTGVEAVMQQQKTGKFKFKCQACKKSLEDNTKMMKHLHGHINALRQFNLDLSDLTHCKYCFREFASPYAMQSHVEEVHVNEPVTPVCRICDKEFASIHLLCEHMKSLHKEYEMPYKCQVCKYRTSFYRDLIDHFQKIHDKTDKLMCNYCLQVFPVRFSAGIHEGQTYLFYRHLYKHQSKTHNRRCQSCCLAFLSNTELQQHRSADHCSFRNVKGVKPATISSTSKSVYIDIEGLVALETETKEEREYLCVECKSSINEANHYINFLSCSMCSYQTCCGRGFANHTIISHSRPSRLRPPPFHSIVKEMSCACGVLSRSGDEMAKHLSQCDNKFCQFTENEYDENFDVSACLAATMYEDESHSDTNKEEEEEESKCNDTVRNDDQHNMMNVLGLVRVNTHKQRSSGQQSYD